MMASFKDAVEDPGQRQELHNAIRGRGAFRCFKDTVLRFGIQDDWYRYRDKELRRIVIAWLKESGIEYADDSDGRPSSGLRTPSS